MKFRNFQKGLKKFAAASLAVFLLNGCGDSENFVFTNSIPQVNVFAPVANNDTVVALGNATLNQLVANGVLGNDEVNGAEIDSFDSTTTAGGSVTLNADGSFSYTPVFGFTGTDSFTYTLANSVGSSTATVTLNVNNQGWFVNNAAPSNGNGSQAAPFDNLDDAVLEADAGDTIFVFRGDGLTTNQSGPITLRPGVNLVGQANGLTLAQQIEAPGGRPVIQGPITLQGDNTVAGFEITGSTGDAVSADSVNNINVHNNIFNTPAESHLDFDDVGGTCSITENTFNAITSSFQYVDILATDTTGTYSIVGNQFLTDNTNDPDDTACDIELVGASNFTIAFNDNTITSVDTTNEFTDGLEVDASGTTVANLTISGNRITRGESDAIDVDTNGSSTLSAVISGNTIESPGDNGIESDSDGGTMNLTIEGNAVSDADQDGIDVDADGTDATVVAIVSNNNVTNSGQNGLSASATGTDSECTVRFANNMVTNSVASIFIESGSTGDVCADITGNTVDDDMVFNNSGDSLTVELLNMLSSLNTFTAGSVDNMGATEVPDNTCVFP